MTKKKPERQPLPPIFFLRVRAPFEVAVELMLEALHEGAALQVNADPVKVERGDLQVTAAWRDPKAAQRAEKSWLSRPGVVKR